MPLLSLCYATSADVIIVLKPQEILHGGEVGDLSGRCVKCFSALETVTVIVYYLCERPNVVPNNQKHMTI